MKVLIAVLAVPVALVLLLLVEAQFPALDDFTLQMPMGLRAMVSQMALRNAGDDPASEEKVYRAVTLDPENESGWSRLCSISGSDDTASALTICRKAVSLRPTAWNFNWLGVAEERAGDACAAEESFHSAVSMKRERALFQRNLGRAALRCGHNGAAVSGFEEAQALDAQTPDSEQSRAVLIEDREYLMLAYRWANQPEKASVLCLSVHPTWADCVCELKGSGVECLDGAAMRRR